MISDSIPVELNLDILSRLPEKSVARFRCVSKVWASILGGQDFKDLFLAKSSTQPRLLFGIEENNKWSIYSLPQRPRAYASGLFYFYVDKEIWSHVLPYIRRYRKTYSFFGFDPVYKQFKVLFMAYPFGPGDHRIMTLGTMGMRWRKIKCSLRHECVSSGICINGILYYLGDLSDCVNNSEMIDSFVIVCFYVRSNYKGKLGLVYYEDQSDNAIKLRVWVLEDVEKQEWSKYAFTLRDDRFFLRH
ncbi:hypothetical protein N665_0753s0014, partial [Sinapis alba]